MMITVHMLLYSVKNRTKLICLYHIIYIDYIFKIKQHQFLKYLLVLNMTIIKKCQFLGGTYQMCSNSFTMTGATDASFNGNKMVSQFSTSSVCSWD